jgi:glutaredoxin
VIVSGRVGKISAIRNPKSAIVGCFGVGELVALDTIVVYTADGCPHCAALCADFDRRGVVYREVNLSREPDEMKRVRDMNWEHRLPVVADHERVSIGFRGGSSTFAELGLE